MIFSLSACTSTTRIQVDDPDVRIYVNDELWGIGQTRYSDKKISGARAIVVLKKSGCREQVQVFERNERIDYWALGFGVLLVPLLWVLQYDEERQYKYECLSS